MKPFKSHAAILYLSICRGLRKKERKRRLQTRKKRKRRVMVFRLTMKLMRMLTTKMAARMRKRMGWRMRTRSKKREEQTSQLLFSVVVGSCNSFNCVQQTSHLKSRLVVFF